VGSLHLCLKKGISSIRSPYPRKRPKCAYILGYYDIGLQKQNRTTFCMFSLGRVVQLSWFLLQWAMLLETQVKTTRNILFQKLWNSIFFMVDAPWGTPKNVCWRKNKYFPLFFYMLVTTLDTCWSNIKT
jgi:hypothetical protein